MGKDKNDKKTDELFWADQLANQILTRKKFHYTEKEIPKFDVWPRPQHPSIAGCPPPPNIPQLQHCPSRQESR